MDLICWDFCINIGVDVIHSSRSPLEKGLVLEIYNKSGVLVHDGEQHKLLHAEWSDFVIDFYNHVAQYSTDIGGIHEDISDVISEALSAKNINVAHIELLSTQDTVSHATKMKVLDANPGLSILKKRRKDNPEEARKVHSAIAKKGWKNRRNKASKVNCQVCGKEYETYFPKRSKFCHQNCKATARRRKAGIQPRH